MPDDYQAILDDLGVNTQTNQNGDVNTNNQPNPTVPDANGQADGASNNGDGAANPATDPATSNQTNPTNPNNNNNSDDQEARQRNEAFAAMRSENSKYKKFIQHLMRGANFQGSEEDFVKQLTEAAYQKQAQVSQVSPEVLKRMDALEAQNRTLTEAQNREMFATKLKNLQTSLSLSDNEIRDFVKFAAENRIDILSDPHMDFVTMYQGIFHKQLTDKAIENARQEWIAQNKKADSASNPDGKSGTKDPTPTDVNTMAEFDSLLQSIPNNKK